MKLSLVSVIIPSYNSRQWLGQTIDSVLAQSYKAIEIILVNDGSTDGTEIWAEKQYGNKIHILNQPNQGIGAARNKGLKISRGEFILLLDSDDLIGIDMVENEVEYLVSHHECACVHCNIEMFYDASPTHRAPWLYSKKFKPRYNLKNLVEQCPFLIQACLMRRKWIEHLGYLDETFKIGDEVDLLLRIASNKGNIDYLGGKPRLFYRIREDSSSHRHVLHTKGYLDVLRKFENSIKSTAERRRLKVRRAIAGKEYELGIALFKEGKKNTGWLKAAYSLLHNRQGIGYKIFLLVLLPFVGYMTAQKIIGRLSECKKSILTRVIS